MRRGRTHRGTFLSLLLFVLLGFLFACSSSRKIPEAAPKGKLQVHVRAMTDAERVAAIRITLQPTVEGNATTIVLDRKVNGGWSQTISNLPVGTYVAVASALSMLPSDPSFDEGSDLLFRSEPTNPFSITKGQTTPVFLFLRQQLSDPSFDTPYFTSITFGSTPTVGEAVEINAKGGGGDGVLSLSGSGHGSFAESAGDGASAAGATIEWTPASVGEQQISLHLGDGKGNEAAVSLQVQVDGASNCAPGLTDCLGCSTTISTADPARSPAARTRPASVRSASRFALQVSSFAMTPA